MCSGGRIGWAPCPGAARRRRARRRRTARRVLLVVLVAALVTGGVVYVGIRDRPRHAPTGRGPSPSASPTPTPAEQRGPERAADRAPGRSATGSTGATSRPPWAGRSAAPAHYGSGDRVALAPGPDRRVPRVRLHLRGRDGAEARVWVFAEPVTAAVGRSIVRRGPRTSRAARCGPARRRSGHRRSGRCAAPPSRPPGR